MWLDRKKTRLIKMSDNRNSDYMNGNPLERFSVVWDITVELWSIATKGKITKELRLDKSVEVLKIHKTNKK